MGRLEEINLFEIRNFLGFFITLQVVIKKATSSTMKKLAYTIPTVRIISVNIPAPVCYNGSPLSDYDGTDLGDDFND